MSKANKSTTKNASNTTAKLDPTRSEAEKRNAGRKLSEAEEAAKDTAVVPALIPRSVADAAVAGDSRKFLEDRRQEELREAADTLEKRNESILAERKEREGQRQPEGTPKELNPVDGPELILENPNDDVLEVSVAAETYYLKPGDNKIVSRDPRLSDRTVADFIHGKLLSRGVIFREEGGVGKKSASESQDPKSQVAKVMEQIPTEGAMDVPEALYDGVKFASNPAGRDRIQPERVQASGPNDPDGVLARERKRKLVEMHVTGELPSEEGDGGKAGGPKQSQKGGTKAQRKAAGKEKSGKEKSAPSLASKLVGKVRGRI
jgi:hypothetical protein